MKKIKNMFFILLLLSPMFVSISYISFIPPNNLKNISIIPSADDGVDKYEINQSVTYSVEVSFSLTHNSGSGGYYFKFSQLNDRQPESPLTKYCAPYQESKLKSNNITGHLPSEINLSHHDKFNNTFDSFNASLAVTETVELTQEYKVTLNEIYFSGIKDDNIGEYNVSDEMFALYCNRSELYYERSDPTLITKSNQIVDPSDNPVQKAKDICNWVSSYLSYKPLSKERGALWAYGNKSGDCSDYSDLMITLLRIQGIPARKVIGFLVSNDPTLRPEKGDDWKFTETGTQAGYTSNFKGHAWVEYYVPNIGWIACDPTWNNNDFDYFNRIDYLRFNLDVGAWFFLPAAFNVSEIGNPGMSYDVSNTFNYEYKVKVTVTDVDLVQTEPPDIWEFLILIIIICIIIGVIIAIIVIVIKKRRD